MCFVRYYDSCEGFPIVQQGATASCTECGGAHLLRDNETGELICRACGMVVSSALLDTGPEWRAFDPVQRNKLPRIGAPTNWTIHDKGLSTTIGWQDRDASGKRLSPEGRARLYRLRKWQHRSKVWDNVNRNLAYALGEMTRISSRLNLPKNVVKTSSMLYRKALKVNLIRGRTIQCVAVACIYMACRQCGVIRTLEDVASSANISKKAAARNYRFLLRELKSTVPKVDPQGYIGKIVNKLALTGETERLAISILYQASLMKLTGGRGPSGMAAACVYISTRITDDHRTQCDIAREAQVTEVTIRNRYKELVKHLELEVQL
ncbi:transcription initiation factor IIB family protein [Thermoproteota archaeon]